MLRARYVFVWPPRRKLPSICSPTSGNEPPASKPNPLKRRVRNFSKARSRIERRQRQQVGMQLAELRAGREIQVGIVLLGEPDV
jgi:hypothetical protein